MSPSRIWGGHSERSTSSDASFSPLLLDHVFQEDSTSSFSGYVPRSEIGESPLSLSSNTGTTSQSSTQDMRPSQWASQDSILHQDMKTSSLERLHVGSSWIRGGSPDMTNFTGHNEITPYYTTGTPQSFTYPSDPPEPPANFWSAQSPALFQPSLFSAAERDDTPCADDKPKLQRRQGVTCDQCRSKHIRCVPLHSNARESYRSVQHGKEKCARCTEKNLECTRNYTPPSRRYPRPSRTGKRIEQARLIHGSIGLANLTDTELHNISGRLTIPQLPHSSNATLQNGVLAGSASLRLLTCFFATAHMQMPIVDFHNFSARYNFACGSPRIMAIMANGGDDNLKIPAARQSAPGLISTMWPPGADLRSSHSTLASTGTTEALIAAMHAWAALYTDMPIAFGSAQRKVSEKKNDGNKEQASSSAETSNVDHSTPQLVMGANGKLRRPKRKQGVACDTCRLRRLRCDKLERPEGMGCSRCEDKRIVCTDEYIQSKRKKNEPSRDSSEATDAPLQSVTAVTEVDSMPLSSPENYIGEVDCDNIRIVATKGADDEQDVISSAPIHPRDIRRGSSAASWVESQEQRSWRDDGPKFTEPYEFGRARDMLAYGEARQAFFQPLLQRAIDLAYMHKLVERPSLEAIQTLMILVQILDLIKRDDQDEANIFADALYSHATVLGLESTDEVDEQDRHAVEQILGVMQRKRLWCCVWTRDALVSGLFRRIPTFESDRPLGIKGIKGRSSQQEHPINKSEGHLDSERVPRSPPKPEMNGEMGLSFSILALMQIGALSRFAGRHLDNISQTQTSKYSMHQCQATPSAFGAMVANNLSQGTKSSNTSNRSAPEMRFPLLPSAAELKRLVRACQALWKSIDSLLIFFDECALKARQNMESLHPFNPLCWIATIKVAGSMLDLCAFRILSERLQLARAYLQSTELSFSADKQQLAAEQERVAELAALQETSRKRTLVGCRRIVKLTEFLLTKNVFQTGGIILRHLVLVAQYLARSPTEPQFLLDDSIDSASYYDDLSTSAALKGVNPRNIFGESSTPSQWNLPGSTSKSHVPESIFTAQLEPFNTNRKRYEVTVCLEAIAQLGYAWPGMDSEISVIEEMLRMNS